MNKITAKEWARGDHQETLDALANAMMALPAGSELRLVTDGDKVRVYRVAAPDDYWIDEDPRVISSCISLSVHEALAQAESEQDEAAQR